MPRRAQRRNLRRDRVDARDGADRGAAVFLDDQGHMGRGLSPAGRQVASRIYAAFQGLILRSSPASSRWATSVSCAAWARSQ